MAKPKKRQRKRPQQKAAPSQRASRARLRSWRAPVEIWEAEDKERIRRGLSKALPETALSESVLDTLARTRPMWSVKRDEPAPASSNEFIERILSKEGLAVIKEAVIPFEKIVAAWLDPPIEFETPAPKKALTSRERKRILSDLRSLKESLRPLADLGRQPAGYATLKLGGRKKIVPAFSDPRTVYRVWVDPQPPGEKDLIQFLEEDAASRGAHSTKRNVGLLDGLASYVKDLPVKPAKRPSTFAPLEKAVARQLVEIARESTRSTIHTERADRQDTEPQFSKPLHELCSKLFWIRWGRTISRKTFADLVKV